VAPVFVVVVLGLCNVYRAEWIQPKHHTVPCSNLLYTAPSG